MKNRNLIHLKHSQPEAPVRRELRSGSQADWGSLVRGMTITVTTAAGERFTGTVDHVTFDGLVMWVHLERGQGRRLFVFNDIAETKVSVHGGHSSDPASSAGRILSSL
jgi:ABC-type nitrate/sulfonate/bicarbonate transport system substrate-binding protein